MVRTVGPTKARLSSLFLMRSFCGVPTCCISIDCRPSKDWLKSTFPLDRWDLGASNDKYGKVYVAWVASFEAVLASWDDGVFTAVAPAGGMPHAGLYRCIVWSRERGEKKQAE